ncbi:hypothetical protein PULV_b0100 [Pseudoalteromonas ulvae UL12]|uniref:hypothetical protein n=1 Tax=Pseudoalteromonas ulvae TaxID=107327 RepID=UPI00186B888D|nr:hypothetical protein [Pseudoalteromonas ulvae]MBE0365514.1 hypothetical protein [Pseudoalteromonas ulvae UL12]
MDEMQGEAWPWMAYLHRLRSHQLIICRIQRDVGALGESREGAAVASATTMLI